MKKSPEVLLAFDFGLKRIGVAVGQTVTMTARPLTTLKALDGVPQWTTVDKIISDWRPDAFVVGIPLNMDGTEQLLTVRARQFAEELINRYHIILYEMDERLSTKDARARVFAEGGYKALQKGKGQIDCVAAQLLLENWLVLNNKL